MWSEVSRRLLAWYGETARSLPWRGIHDAYSIWVSEIMLQQTRVETVIPYFHRWMNRFPTLPSLAEASQEDVLRLWEGLGYYSRAVQIHRAARAVMAEHGGVIPEDVVALRALPGVGEYTAAAIASIAFGADLPAIDGNLRRVLSRVFDVSLPVRSPEGERRLLELAQEHLPAGLAGDYNQAWMDLGATICLPKKPACLICPLSEVCLARQHGTQADRPVLPPKKAVPHITVAAAVIDRDGKVLLARRPPNGLLGGLWEFPGGKQEPGEALPDTLRREIREELDYDIQVGSPIGVYQHAFTHFKVTLHAFDCRPGEGEPKALEASALSWAALQELDGYPMGKIDRMISRDLQARANGAGD